MTRHGIRIIVTTFAAVFLAPVAWTQTAADLDRQLAREPAEIVTTGGRIVRAILDGVRDGRLHARLATDGGEVGYSFAPAEIARLTLPGSGLESDATDLLERGDVAQAMPLLEALGRHRIRYLPVLDVERQRPLWLLASHANAAGDAHGARAIIRSMQALADTPDKRRLLLEAELELAVRLGDAEEIYDLAWRWCAEADPAGPNALGWRVLARLAYDAGDDDRACWLALQPVTFSGHLGMRDLDLCYAIAIAATDRRGDVAHARILHAEMISRELAWPAEPALAPLGAHYAGNDTGRSDAPFHPRSVSAASPQPAADAFRKLTSTPAVP